MKGKSLYTFIVRNASTSAKPFYQRIFPSARRLIEQLNATIPADIKYVTAESLRNAWKNQPMKERVIEKEVKQEVKISQSIIEDKPIFSSRVIQGNMYSECVFDELFEDLELSSELNDSEVEKMEIFVKKALNVSIQRSKVDVKHIS